MNGTNGTDKTADASGRWAARNLNSIMLAIVLLGIGAIARIGWDNSMTLAEMKGGLVNRTELEAKLLELKTQFEARNAELKTSQLGIEKDLAALKLALAERGITSGAKR